MFAKCSHFVNHYAPPKKRYKCKEQKDAAQKGGVKFLPDTTNLISHTLPATLF